MEKFYLWTYTASYGWRPYGNLEGYATLEDLRSKNDYVFENVKVWKILKAVEIESQGAE